MTRKLLFLLPAVLFFSFAVAQQVPPTYQDDDGMLPDNRVFIGGSINLGFSSGSFNVGGVPEVGYSISEWLDLGLAFNINYYTISAEYNGGLRQRSFNYGGGPFVRIYPLSFLFIQGQFENNWVKHNLKDEFTGQSYKVTTSAPSVLAGIGYTQRIVGQSSFYTALMVDLNTNPNSPYRDGYNRVVPIVRAGFNFYLKGRQK
ncbi:hypothetical protein [Foetidibacter luteolus]|uniref:hypothetical protein n=1 Tax=Foetidibacter luteolus TaxID=2608880 RepID=UPI00129AE84A|nr:hypothetical protein [Foetidibacter luteolus]